MILFNKTVKLIPGQKLYLIPFGDVHYDSNDCDRDRFHGLFDWAINKVNQGEKVIMQGMGDYLDFASDTERALLGKRGKGSLHDSSKEALDRMIVESLTLFAKPVQKALACGVVLLGMLEGNHHFEFMTESMGKWQGRSSTELLASWFGVPFFGDLALGTLKFPPAKKGLEVLFYHGSGSGGRSKGGRLMKRKNAADAFPSTNLIFQGHDHEKVVGCDEGLVLDPTSPDGITYNKRYYIGTGSFLKGYRVGATQGGYVERAVLPPSGLGTAIVEISLEERKGKARVDYHVSI